MRLLSIDSKLDGWIISIQSDILYQDKWKNTYDIMDLLCIVSNPTVTSFLLDPFDHKHGMEWLPILENDSTSFLVTLKRS